ncbi:MAG: trypsin-like peptidase domain-containing protein [Dermatophilus congolensis]|nr:trypsin-like peptidase domain-containing protein [Dermatophilus congolensis]
MADNSLPPYRSSSGGPDPQSQHGQTTWHGSDEPPAPWERAGEQTTAQYPPVPPQRAPKARNRRRSGIVAALAVLVVALAASAALMSGGLTSNNPTTMQRSEQAAPQRIQAAPGPVQQASGTTPDWTATAEAVAPSVVSITVDAYQGTAQGSGVILDATGHVITNHHVVADAVAGRGQIAVTLNDKRTYVATVLGSDPSTDLAVLEMQNAPDDLRPVTLGDSDALKVGVPVMAIGNPLGLSGTVTTGIVSALDRPLITRGGGRGSDFGAISDDVVTNAIQTSAAINPGNSGGALVNASGQLIGINSSIAQTSQDGGNIGIGFAIPVNAAKNIADQLMQNGKVRHAFLGVSTETGNVPDGSAQRAAALVADVTPGAPAAQAGIRRGDAIVALDGDVIDGSASLVAQVRDRQVDQQVKVTIVRSGQRSDVQVTLAGRPQDG